MRKLVFVLVFALAACAPTKLLVDSDGIYRAPVGEFSCGPFPLPTQIQEAFLPNGGTVRFSDEIRSFRVDVEKFEPALDKATLAPMVERLYQGYMQQNTMPLIQSGIPNAKLESAELMILDGKDVFRSIVSSPPKSDGDGGTTQELRGLLQYTNGQYIYTVTEIGYLWDKEAFETKAARILKLAERSFKRCTFP